jgi:hypothetical protein
LCGRDGERLVKSVRPTRRQREERRPSPAWLGLGPVTGKS